jgi:hypothetical protein
MGSTTSKRLKRVYTVYERYVNEYGDGTIPGHVIGAALSGGDEWAKVQDEWATEDATFPWKAGDTLTALPDEWWEWLNSAPAGTVIDTKLLDGTTRRYRKTEVQVRVRAWSTTLDEYLWELHGEGGSAASTSILVNLSDDVMFVEVPPYETPVTAE